jgi:methionine synthase I (cobalamin-dependent)
MIKPVGDTDPEVVYASFREQISTLLAAGADMICVETMTDLAEATLARKAVRSLDSKIPVMATMTFGRTPQGFFTLMGTSIQNAAAALESGGANIIGSNCGEGAESMIGIAREFRQYSAPVAIQNARVSQSPRMRAGLSRNAGYIAGRQSSC